MRTWLVVSAFLTVALAGCFDDIPESPEEQVDVPEVPTTGIRPGHETLYLHADDDETWMDQDATETDELSGTVTLADGGTTYAFPLVPAPERDVVHAGAVRVVLDVQTGGAVGDFPYIEVDLVVDGTVVDSDGGTGEAFELDSPTWPAGSDVELRVCFCPAVGVIAYNYQFFTDGDSKVTLDLGSDASASGEPGSGSESSGSSESSGVTVEKQGDRYVARRSETFDDAFSATHATVLLDTFNGGVSVARGGTGSHLEADLAAWGDTEQEARDRLASMRVEHAATDGAVFDLDVRIVAPDSSNRSAGFRLTLPAVVLDELSLDTSNAAVSVVGFDGGDWSIDTSNAGVTVTDGTVDSLAIDSSNGGLVLDLTVDDLEADTSNGGVDATLRAAGSGDWVIDTSNAGVSLKVPEDGQRGYDLSAKTTNGQVTFDMDDTEPVGEQDDDARHERTNGFATRAIQTTVDVGTTNASVLVEGGA